MSNARQGWVVQIPLPLCLGANEILGRTTRDATGYYLTGMPSYAEVTASLRPSGPEPLFTTTTESMVGD